MEDDLPKKLPSQLPPPSDGKNPNVLIVGAGMGGLVLALLLEKAGIPYQVYERSAEVRPLGKKATTVFLLLQSLPDQP